MQTTHEMEEPSHLEFETGADDQPIAEPSQHPGWFSQQKKPPTPDRRRVIPFDHFINNDLEYICGGASSCKYTNSVTKTKLDWVNPEGQQYLHNLLQPLPLISYNRGRSVIPFEHFINNDLEYLRGGALSRKYTTSVTKTKEEDYGHIKWIEDLVPCAMWIQEPISYDKHALWGVSHWGRKHQRFYWFAVNRESALDVYSKRRIIAKRLNLTKPDTYRSDLKRQEAYTAYSNPRGFIYQNKEKINRLMRIDELHKFSDGTLNDVRNSLDDRLKGI
nr:hypothetical protein [Tanacetum cinerariifolium]